LKSTQTREVTTANRKVLPLPSGKRLAGVTNRNINDATAKLNQVNQSTREIASQGGFAAFFQKGRNIRRLAEHIEVMTNVQQITLDLMVLTMNGLAITKRDYNTLTNLMEKLGSDDSIDKHTRDFVNNARRLFSSNREIRSTIDNLVSSHNEMIDIVELMQKQASDSRQSQSEILDQLQSRIDTNEVSLRECTDKHTKGLAVVTKRVEILQKESKGALDSLNGVINKRLDGFNEEINSLVSSHNEMIDIVELMQKQASDSRQSQSEILDQLQSRIDTNEVSLRECTDKHTNGLAVVTKRVETLQEESKGALDSLNGVINKRLDGLNEDINSSNLAHIEFRTEVEKRSASSKSELHKFRSEIAHLQKRSNIMTIIIIAIIGALVSILISI